MLVPPVKSLRDRTFLNAVQNLAHSRHYGANHPHHKGLVSGAKSMGARFQKAILGFAAHGDPWAIGHLKTYGSGHKKRKSYKKKRSGCKR
jgi:hypothetical protein